MVFRDDVRIEDRSRELPVVLAIAPPEAQGVLGENARAPIAVATGDGTLLALDGREAMPEAERIARLLPRHGHEIAEAFNPFEVGLGHEVHLDKGCFTGQEALQRLVTYGGVRRRPVHVRLSAPTARVPVDLFAGGVRAGVLTSVAGREGIAVLREEPLSNHAEVSLADGTSVRVLSAPEPSRPLGRP